jgi:hypothetical protein
MLISHVHCAPELRAPGREKHLLFLIENRQKQIPLPREIGMTSSDLFYRPALWLDRESI